MDIAKVEVVRSAKGHDMLCVDNFLYYLDDRDDSTFRWVCHRRKDKIIRCRSRIVTTFAGGDETTHTVQKVCGEHTHQRCSPEEIVKFQHRMRCDADSGAVGQNSGVIISHGQKKTKYFKLPGRDQKLLKETYEAEMATKTKNVKKDTLRAHSDNFNDYNFEKNKLYMLKTLSGRQMLCLNGYIYRQDGKSKTRSTYRWMCIRHHDAACSKRIYTECMANECHKFKAQSSKEVHLHEPYSSYKLTKLLYKNNISSIVEHEQDDHERDDNDEADFQFIHDNPMLDESTQFVRNEMENDNATELVLPFGSPKTRSYYQLCEDPLAVLGENRYASTQDPTKFFFLPTSKGKQVLVFNNYTFHFNFTSRSNGHSYWSCTAKRKGNANCRVHVITTMTDSGPTILNVSGRHTHPNCEEEVKRRIQKSLKLADDKKKPPPQSTTKGAVQDKQKAESYQSLTARLEILRKEMKKDIAEECKRLPNPMGYDHDSDSGSCSDGSSSSSILSSLDSMDEDLDWYGDEPNGMAQLKRIIEPEIVFIENDDVAREAMDIMVETAQVEYDQKQATLRRSKRGATRVDQNAAVPPKKRYIENSSFEAEEHEEPPQMDLTKITKMRSAKGGELLCIDGYIYHLKGTVNGRTYWICIKSKDRLLQCKSRVATIALPPGDEITVIRVSNRHSHSVIKNDIKRRLYNTIVQTKPEAGLVKMKPGYVIQKSFTELNCEYGGILNEPVQSLLEQLTDDNPNRSAMKLYAVSDGPPSLAVRMTLKALNIEYELMNVDYINSEHLSDDYAKLNPQKEIPVLDDDGFYLSESIAIMQYLCDKYAANTKFYPKEATQRAVVNQRLCFNMGFYYASISAHCMAPIFFDYQRTEMSLKKVNNALDVFETYLKRSGTKYVASDNVTIADFALVSATLCLEAIGFNLSPWPLVNKWYDTFKLENETLWAIANEGMQEIRQFEANPPDLSHMNHPFHPTRKEFTQ